MTQRLSAALEVVGLSDPGMVRGHNEDAIAMHPDLGLVVLADGMGGYNAGEVASGIATTLLAEGVKSSLELLAPHLADPQQASTAIRRLLSDEIAKANLAIFQTAQSQPQCAGMGTTLVTALFRDNKLTVAHVGDSRLYRLRAEQFEVVTKDHSLLQEQIDSGFITPAQAKLSHNKNLVTRAVGVDPDLDADIAEHEVLAGDVYLLCSDGLNDMVDDEEIGLVLNTLRGNLPVAAAQLIQMANDNGGRDNVSVILIRVKQPFAAERSFWARLFGWLAK